MLWSDPENKPPKELRDAQDMIRRAGLVLALAMLVGMLALGIR
ncbi:morphogenic membrane protein MmpB [Streptomyces sp. NPDC002476]